MSVYLRNTLVSAAYHPCLTNHILACATIHSIDVSASHGDLPVTVAFPCEALTAVLEFQIVDGPMEFDVVFGPGWTTWCKEKEGKLLFL